MNLGGYFDMRMTAQICSKCHNIAWLLLSGVILSDVIDGGHLDILL